MASKADLTAAWEPSALGDLGDRTIAVSALTGEGLGQLRECLVAALVDGEARRDVPLISNLRHLGLVDDARAAVTRALGALAEGATEELVLADLAVARKALEEITGARTVDDLLHHIFSRFCVGK